MSQIKLVNLSKINLLISIRLVYLSHGSRNKDYQEKIIIFKILWLEGKI